MALCFPCFFLNFLGLTCRFNSISPVDNSTTVLNDGLKTLSLAENKSSSKNYAVVDYEDAYVEPKILAALRKYIPNIQTVKTPEELPKDKDIKVINWSAYEKIPFEDVMDKPDNILSCSYIIRCVLHHYHSTSP